MSHDIAVHNSTLDTLKQQPIPGGYETTLTSSVEQIGDKFYMKNIELDDGSIFRSVESIEIFRIEVVDCLIKSVTDRFKVENNALISVIQPFVELQSSANVEKVHELIAKDLDLSALVMQYIDLCAEPHLKEKSLADLVRFVTSAERNQYFKEIAIVLSRILVATPHSADVERCVSANNLLKTALRNSFHIENENKYLFVHFNLPVLEEWNPKKAAAKWVKTGDRRNVNVSTSVGKATAQSYFNGIFRQAEVKNKEEDDGDMAKFKF